MYLVGPFGVFVVALSPEVDLYPFYPSRSSPSFVLCCSVRACWWFGLVGGLSALRSTRCLRSSACSAACPARVRPPVCPPCRLPGCLFVWSFLLSLLCVVSPVGLFAFSRVCSRGVRLARCVITTQPGTVGCAKRQQIGHKIIYCFEMWGYLPGRTLTSNIISKTT